MKCWMPGCSWDWTFPDTTEIGKGMAPRTQSLWLAEFPEKARIAAEVHEINACLSSLGDHLRDDHPFEDLYAEIVRLQRELAPWGETDPELRAVLEWEPGPGWHTGQPLRQATAEQIATAQRCSCLGFDFDQQARVGDYHDGDCQNYEAPF